MSCSEYCMSCSEPSLMGLAEHGNINAIIELLRRGSFSKKLKIYWVWQALQLSDIPEKYSDIPEDDLYHFFRYIALAKYGGRLNASETKLFQACVQQYKSLHIGRACIISHMAAPDEQSERQCLEAGCRAKSRYCAEKLAKRLNQLQAADLCLEATTWSFDKVSDFDYEHNDEALKKRGCDYILEYLRSRNMTLKAATPLLLKVYQNGDAKQKNESAKELEKRTLDLLKDQFSRAETLARREAYKEAVALCMENLNKKEELIKPLLQHDRVDALFVKFESARERYSGEELEKKTLDLLRDQFSKAEVLAQQGRYKEAVTQCAGIMNMIVERKKSFRNLGRAEALEALFKRVESAHAEYLASIRNPFIYITLAFLFGYLGAHDFYAGSPKKGKCKLLLSVLSLGILAPAAWLMGVFQVLNLKANIGCNVQQRKNAKHEGLVVVLNVLLYIFILLAIAAAGAKQKSDLNSGKMARTESRESSAETISEGVLTPDHSKDSNLDAPSMGGSYPRKTASSESSPKDVDIEISVETQPAGSMNDRLLDAVREL